jgi:hypothetical protein
MRSDYKIRAEAYHVRRAIKPRVPVRYARKGPAYLVIIYK